MDIRKYLGGEGSQRGRKRSGAKDSDSDSEEEEIVPAKRIKHMDISSDDDDSSSESVSAGPSSQRSRHEETARTTSRTARASQRAAVARSAKESGITLSSPKHSQPSLASEQCSSTVAPSRQHTCGQLLVDKYKPTSVTKIIGQQAPKSPLSKLLAWLEFWANSQGRKARAATRHSEIEGCQFRAVLLSGPPGVGKTTAAHLACEHVGMAIVDLNSSDQRSKGCLQATNLANVSSSHAISRQSQQRITQRICIVMDEVDGMSGNEDRGGIQELISIIKRTKVPIICICNDRQHPKVRSLANYCFDLRFRRLRPEQIKSCLLSIMSKEGRKMGPDLVERMAHDSGGDLRHAIHSLHMYLSDGQSGAQGRSSCGPDTRLKCSEASSIVVKEDVVISLFDMCRQIFLPAKDEKPVEISERADMFFNDYNMMPLFIHENYMRVCPAIQERKKAVLLSPELASCSALISLGDVVNESLRSLNKWSLLRTVALFSTAAPCHVRQGYLIGIINFPCWLGKQSKKGRLNRQLIEVFDHYKLGRPVAPYDFRLNVAAPLLAMIHSPLHRPGGETGVIRACATAQAFYLQKVDVDNLSEIVLDPPSYDSKLKASFARAMNQAHAIVPYSLRERKKVEPVLDQNSSEQTPESSDDSSDADFTSDKNIRKRKCTRKPRPTRGGRGSGRGSGQTSSGRRGRKPKK